MFKCPFCEISNVIIFETELVISFYDSFPTSPGHALVVPRRHIATYFDCTPEQKTGLQFLYPNTITNGGIELLPGVCFCLRQFHFIISDLIQSAWVRFIHRVRANQGILGEIKDLADFLFGTERSNLSALTGALKEYQHGVCFYCRKPLKSNHTIDHFVPWSRYPLDLGHNMVLAHYTCNIVKSDTLAGLTHLGRWWDRNEKFGKELGEIFDTKNLIHELAATREICCWAYGTAERNGAQVWIGRNQYEKLGPEWRAITGG